MLLLSLPESCRFLVPQLRFRREAIPAEQVGRIVVEAHLHIHHIPAFTTDFDPLAALWSLRIHVAA